MQKFTFKDLYPYQEEDAKRISDSDENFLLLSEMGTGKTPTAIAVGEWTGSRNILVICPKSIRHEWKAQISAWTGNEPTVCGRGSRKRLDPYFLEKPKKESPYFILNYDTFRIEELVDILSLCHFDYIILDEVHQIRNTETKTTKGVMDFLASQKDARTLCMTGSPIVNNLLDLYTTLMVAKPSLYNQKNRFEFLNTFAYWSSTRNRPKIFGIRSEEKLKNHLNPFMIRRLKRDVLQFLPDKYYKRAMLEMEPKQAELHQKMASELLILLDSGETYHAPGVLACLTRLRQISLDPRLIGINADSSKTEFLLDLIDSTDKLVVSCTFESYLRMISETLSERGISHVSITGRTGDGLIAVNAKRFSEDPDCKVCLISTKMGVGFSLYNASDICQIDRWWTPSANNQNVDRLHGIGRGIQDRGLQIILPTNEHSIDEALEDRLEEKRKQHDEVFEENSMISEVLDNIRRYL